MRIQITNQAGIIPELNTKLPCNKAGCGCQIEIQNMSPRVFEVMPDDNLHLFTGDIVLSGTDEEVFDPSTDIWISDAIANYLIEIGWGVKI